MECPLKPATFFAAKQTVACFHRARSPFNIVIAQMKALLAIALSTDDRPAPYSEGVRLIISTYATDYPLYEGYIGPQYDKRRKYLKRENYRQR